MQFPDHAGRSRAEIELRGLQALRRWRLMMVVTASIAFVTTAIFVSVVTGDAGGWRAWFEKIAMPNGPRATSGATLSQGLSAASKMPCILIGISAALILSGGFVLATTLVKKRKRALPTEVRDMTGPAHSFRPSEDRLVGMRSAFDWDEDRASLGEADQGTAVDAPVVDQPNIDDLLDKIVAAHVPGRGLQIVASPLGEAEPEVLIEIGRNLSVKGRTIIVDLNRAPSALATLVDTEEGIRTIMSMDGLAELLGGESTFAEVIRRDQASRLHFIPTGGEDADFRDFDLILDALAETYDFTILLTPDVASSEIAKIMSPYAEFVVLATQESDAAWTGEIEKDLIRAGAREVLVAGASARRCLEFA